MGAVHVRSGLGEWNTLYMSFSGAVTVSEDLFHHVGVKTET